MNTGLYLSTQFSQSSNNNNNIIIKFSCSVIRAAIKIRFIVSFWYFLKHFLSNYKKNNMRIFIIQFALVQESLIIFMYILSFLWERNFWNVSIYHRNWNFWFVLSDAFKIFAKQFNYTILLERIRFIKLFEAIDRMIGGIRVSFTSTSQQCNHHKIFSDIFQR